MRDNAPPARGPRDAPLDDLKKAGMSFADVKVRDFGTSPELAQAFISGSIDAMCHIERYASQALVWRKGAVQLSDGTEVYGPRYTDCVLAVRSKSIQENRPAVKVIKLAAATRPGASSDTDAASLCGAFREQARGGSGPGGEAAGRPSTLEGRPA